MGICPRLVLRGFASSITAFVSYIELKSIYFDVGITKQNDYESHIGNVRDYMTNYINWP